MSKKAPKFLHFKVKYFPTPKLPSLTRRILSSRSHPLYQKFYERYSQRDTNTLWWLVSCMYMNKKKVVRSKATRKCNLAFREVLEMCGYDKDGKPFNGEFHPPLRGYLEIVPNTPSVLAAHEDLQREMVYLLRHVKKSQPTGPMPKLDLDSLVAPKKPKK